MLNSLSESKRISRPTSQPAKTFRAILCALSLNICILALVLPSNAESIPLTRNSVSISASDDVSGVLHYFDGSSESTVASYLIDNDMSQYTPHDVGKDFISTYGNYYRLWSYTFNEPYLVQWNLQFSYIFPGQNLVREFSSFSFSIVYPTLSGYSATPTCTFSWSGAPTLQYQFAHVSYSNILRDHIVVSGQHFDVMTYIFELPSAGSTFEYLYDTVTLNLKLNGAPGSFGSSSGSAFWNYYFYLSEPELYSDKSAIALYEQSEQFHNALLERVPADSQKINQGQEALSDMNDVVGDMADLEASLPEFSADAADISFFGDPSFSVVTDIFQRAWDSDFFAITALTIFSISLFAMILYGKKN